MKRPITSLPYAVIAIAGLLLLIVCANPTDQSLRWRANIQIPVSNESFILGAEFENLFFQFKSLRDLEIRGLNDTTVTGSFPDSLHGVAFSKPSQDTFSFEQTHDSLEDKTFQDVLGPILISSGATYSTLIRLPARTIAAATAFDTVTTIRLPGVRRIVFNSTSPALEISFTNTTAATMTGVTVSLQNVPGTTQASLGTLAPNQTKPAQFKVSGSALDSTLTVRVAGTIQPGTIAAGRGLNAAVSLEGMKANSLTVKDSLVTFSKTYTNYYKITDSVDIDYTDISQGFFSYTLSNKTGLDIEVTGIHHHLWVASACMQKNVVRVEDLGVLANRADSGRYYSGEITQGSRTVPSDSTLEFGKINISGNRLFPTWDGATKNSVSRVDYIVSTPEPRGNWVTLTSNDSLTFIIRSLAVSFKQMNGSLTEDYHKTSDTQWVPIPFPWPASAKDSLRGRFILNRVLADAHVTTSLPDSAWMDSLLLNFEVVAPDYPGDAFDTLVAFGRIRRDTTYVRTINITKVVNRFPDSVAIVTRATVPKGTKILVVNDLSVLDRHIGGMTVRGYVDYRMNAYLDWRVDTSTTMDLGWGAFPVPEKGVRAFRRMSDRMASFDMMVNNRTNVYVKLFALLAPEALMHTIDTLATGDVSAMLLKADSAENRGYVNLLGPAGVLIPPRNGSALNSVRLTDRQLDRILASDSCSWRWQLRFFEKTGDSLSNRDDIGIQSWISLQGVNDMDSLFTSFEN